MNRKILLGIIMAAIVIIAAIGVYYFTMLGPTESNTIKIGMISSLTGGEAWSGAYGLEGAKLAVKEINAAGGINGKQVELVYYDDGGAPDEAVTVSRKLVDVDKVVAVVLNHGSELALPSSSVFDKAKIPAMVAWAGHPDIVKGGYCFMVGMSTGAWGKSLAYFVHTTLNATKIASVTIVDPFEEDVHVNFKNMTEKLGGQIIYEKRVEWNEKEYTSMLTQIEGMNPDLVIMPGDFTMGIPFTTQARGLGIMLPIMSLTGSQFSPEYLQGVGDTAEQGGGVFLPSFLDPEDPVAKVFVAAYRTEFARDPHPVPSYTSYDSVKILAQIIKKVGTDPAQILNGIKTLSSYHGSSGMFQQQVNGFFLKPVPIFTIENQEFKLAATITDPQYITP